MAPVFYMAASLSYSTLYLWYNLVDVATRGCASDPLRLGELLVHVAHVFRKEVSSDSKDLVVRAARGCSEVRLRERRGCGG